VAAKVRPRPSYGGEFAGCAAEFNRHKGHKVRSEALQLIARVSQHEFNLNWFIAARNALFT